MTDRKVDLKELAIAVGGAVLVGGGLGLGLGLAARSFGWPTQFVGPVTGALVGALTAVIYQLRSRKGA